MNKRFDRYFGKNIGRKIYVISIGLVAFGLIFGAVYWWGYGIPIAIIGVIGFLVSSGIQVSDKDIDEHILESVEKYKKNIDGRTLGKETLDVRNFSFFYGFIRDDAATRFVAGRDGSVRTSKYYITAMSVEKNDCKVFTSIFDLLRDETVSEQTFSIKGAVNTKLSTESIDFPRGNRKCTLITEKDGSTEEFIFYLPNDALADKLLEKIKN